MRLHDLKAPRGANKGHKRVGRGESSGWGKTSGRGHKGQGQRSGTGKPRVGFEGGQMPMFRRMPKRGFTNIFRKDWAEVNVDVLAKRFEAGTEVNLEVLRKAGLASKKNDGVRILGRGDIAVALTVKADHFTKAAKEKIVAAGGTVIEPTKAEAREAKDPEAREPEANEPEAEAKEPEAKEPEATAE